MQTVLGIFAIVVLLAVPVSFIAICVEAGGGYSKD